MACGSLIHRNFDNGSTMFEADAPQRRPPCDPICQLTSQQQSVCQTFAQASTDHADKFEDFNPRFLRFSRPYPAKMPAPIDNESYYVRCKELLHNNTALKDPQLNILARRLSHTYHMSHTHDPREPGRPPQQLQCHKPDHDRRPQRAGAHFVSQDQRSQMVLDPREVQWLSGGAHHQGRCDAIKE